MKYLLLFMSHTIVFLYYILKILSNSFLPIFVIL